MGKRGVFEVRFKLANRGRDGGLGPVKSFRTSASCPKAAVKKFRGKGVIVSVQKAR